MSLSCGFFNSIDHDRRYDARDFSRIFDGIIRDGVYATIGDCFIVKAQSGRTVTVGSGRAWFNGTWTLNSSQLLLDLPLSDVVADRIDSVILEVDTRDTVRNNTIKVITGTPSASPARPSMDSGEEGLYWYPLCYVTRRANSTEINQVDIINAVGSTETPFVTGILQIISIDDLVLQWGAQLDNFISDETGDFTKWAYEQQQEFDKWFADQKNKYDEIQNGNEMDYQEWLDATQQTFNTWLQNLQTNLGTDAAGNLQIQIQTDEIKRILTAGFADGVKIISEDGTRITSTATDGRTLTKTFSGDFSQMTAELTSAEGALIAKQIKTFDPAGYLITTNTTYNYGREGI